jgi:hypothetical protein
MASKRLVNAATWRSNVDFQAAHATEFVRARIQDPAWAESSNFPALYEVAAEGSV